MRASFLLAVFIALLVGGTATSGDDKQVTEKKLIFKLRVCEGDPLGSTNANSLRIIAAPELMTLVNQPFIFQAGGGIATPPTIGADFKISDIRSGGIRLEGKPGHVKDGSVPLELNLSYTKRVGRSDGLFQLSTETVQGVVSLKFGQVVKSRLGTGAADNQTWIELTALDTY